MQDQVATGAFHMPDRSQANLLGLTLWGTLWVRLFGFSFSILTASTLVLAFACLVAFYCLARALDVPPSGALLGTALVGFNPLFLHLSYSFMTDMPFLALEIIACLCFVLGLKRHAWWWLLLGGLAAGYAYLIRQFGVIPPACFVAYLALDGLVTRRWRWREMVEIVAIPAIVRSGLVLLFEGFP